MEFVSLYFQHRNMSSRHYISTSYVFSFRRPLGGWTLGYIKWKTFKYLLMYSLKNTVEHFHNNILWTAHMSTNGSLNLSVNQRTLRRINVNYPCTCIEECTQSKSEHLPILNILTQYAKINQEWFEGPVRLIRGVGSIQWNGAGPGSIMLSIFNTTSIRYHTDRKNM